MLADVLQMFILVKKMDRKCVPNVCYRLAQALIDTLLLRKVRGLNDNLYKG